MNRYCRYAISKKPLFPSRRYKTCCDVICKLDKFSLGLKVDSYLNFHSKTRKIHICVKGELRYFILDNSDIGVLVTVSSRKVVVSRSDNFPTS